MKRHARLALLIAIVLAAGSPPVAAQQGQPFDMTGEKGGGTAPGEALPMQPGVPVSPGVPSLAPPAISPSAISPPAMSFPGTTFPPAGGVPIGIPIRPPAAIVPDVAAPRVVPGVTPSPTQPAPAAQSVAPAVTPPAMQPAATPSPAPVATSAGGRSIRYIVPQRTLRFEGENDEQTWSVFLTADQAARGTRIKVSYKNAIVVMPEASRLRVSLNGQVVIEAPLASSDRYDTIAADVPAGLLHAGANLLRFQTFQRHRTDCSIQSTYELWADIDPAQTMLEFEGGSPGVFQTLEDLPAVGYGSDGTTSIHIVTPAGGQQEAVADLLKLAQSLALFGAYPNPSISFTEGMAAADKPGTLTVLVGTGSEIDPLLATPRFASTGQPSVSFVDDPGVGASVLVVSGANRGQIGAAIDAIAQRVDRPLGTRRAVLNTASWLSPDVHYFTGRESVTLEKLGVPTQQFSGRRFRAEFAIGIPADFYAEAYGEATILLDAAYTSAVLPASHIDIYVNGQIAATTRVVNRTGGIFRHLPIQIPFRHFHAGVNRIVMEAVLDTEADRACAPGGSISGPDRFVLFDTTEFSMPAFARIARKPDLAGFAGTGFPYSRTAAPVALVLGRSDSPVLSAAATLMGRLAVQGGRVVPLALTPIANVGDQQAIFVGAAPQFPDGTFARFGVANSVQTAWKSEFVPSGRSRPAGSGTDESVANKIAPPIDAEAENTDAVFDKWRTQLAGGGGWRGQVSSFEDWMKRNFDISFASLRLGPATEVAFEPHPKTTLLLAQAVSPGGGTWTMMTAPSAADLVDGARSIAGIETWSQIGGQFSAFTNTTGRIENQAPAQTSFVVTQPLTLQNLRLIGANWFSSNIVFYAVGLIGLCVFLGVITSGLLYRFGRPS